MSKIKLCFHNQSNQVPYVVKTRQDNDVIVCICVVYTENEIRLLCLIGLGGCLTKTRHDNDVIDHISMVYAEIETKMMGPI